MGDYEQKDCTVVRFTYCITIRVYHVSIHKHTSEKNVDRTITYQNGIQTDCYSLDMSTAAFDQYKGTYFDSDINKEEVSVKLLEETGLYKKNIGIRWSGYIKTPENSDYIFSVDSKSKVKLWINNVLVMETQVDDAATVNNSLYLKKDAMNKVKIECYKTSGSGKITVYWQNKDALKKTSDSRQCILHRCC